MNRFLVLIASLVMTACTHSPRAELPPVGGFQQRLAAGDRLKLDVFREKDLSGEYTVNDEGNLAMPMIGTIKAAGKTLPDLRQELGGMLSEGFVRDARITLEVVSYRPIYILGEVQKPGEYTFSEGMSVFALVAKAGGFTYRANQSVVHIRHANESTERAYRVTSGAAVVPGDTIRIGPRFF